ncbi:polyamine transporter 4 [Clavulina sp. PMI_390]|nr:polyamine transporter 4 [Clavulina sp. PMI_390]
MDSQSVASGSLGASIKKVDPSTSSFQTDDRSSREDVTEPTIDPSDHGIRLANQFSPARKWCIAAVICIIQVSMNINTSLYSNAMPGVMEEFNISDQAFRAGAAVFLVMYAIGSLLWAPWSEELGRKNVLQLSLFLVNIFQIPCALAPNFASIVVGRFFGGLCSAGGSVTLGTIADLWDVDEQQIPVVIVVFFSVTGAGIGPIPGAFIQEYLNWRWAFWVSLIFGGFTQLLHFLVVPETRSTVLLEQGANKLRKEGRTREADAIQFDKPVLDMKHAMTIWIRPFEMFIREPIVLLLSMLSGFSDALVFTFIEAFGMLFEQWNFSTIEIGLAFIPIILGYVIAAGLYLIFPIRRDNKLRRQGVTLTPESRLWMLLYLGPLLPIGLFGVAWLSFPSMTYWPTLFFCLVFGIANYAIYMSSIDYMVASYGPFSSSASAGNAFARDGLAGAASLYATPMYHKLKLHVGTTVLACIALFVTIPIYVFYIYGPQIRARSKFATILAEEREARETGSEKPRTAVNLAATAPSYLRVLSGANSRASAVTGPGRSGVPIARRPESLAVRLDH